MTDTYDIDYETFSECDIRNSGAAKYAEHPSTLILMFAISKNESDPVLWCIDNPKTKESLEAIRLFKEAIKSKSRIFAHNYQFEHFISKYCLKKQLGIDPPAVEQWRCTAATARIAAIPFALGTCAKFLNLPQQKDDAGKALIQLFSVPHKKLGRITSKSEGTSKIVGEDLTRLEAWNKFTEYCKQDVITQIAIRKKLAAFDFDRGERPVHLAAFQFDARLNDRGLPVNTEALTITQKLVENYKEDIVKKFTDLVGFAPSRRAKVLDWLKQGAYPEDNMQSATVENVLSNFSHKMDEDAVEALKMYKLLSFSALAKIPKMIETANEDGRIRGTIMWAGAIRTHRWTGRMVQPQNMRKSSIEDSDLAYEMLCDPNTTPDDLEMLWGSPLEVVASCVRNFIQDPDHKLFDVDYSNIEARILAWLAGEEWKLDAFAKGEDLYKKLASVIFDTPIEEITKAQRFIGKTGELGCGYQTGSAKFSDMLSMFGYATPEDQVSKFLENNEDKLVVHNTLVSRLYSSTGDKVEHFNYSKSLSVKEKIDLKKSLKESSEQSNLFKLTEVGDFFSPVGAKHVGLYIQGLLAKKVVDTFRTQNPKVVAMWKEFDSAAKEAIRNGGEETSAAGGRVKFALRDVGFPALLMKLPSRHCLVFPKPHLKKQIKKHTDKQGNIREWETEVIAFQGMLPNGGKFGTCYTYGGKLVENACQAIGGDFLSHGVVEAEKLGYETFAIIHDQALAPVKDGLSLEAYTNALCHLPEWAEGFPLAGDGNITKYYTKD